MKRLLFLGISAAVIIFLVVSVILFGKLKEASTVGRKAAAEETLFKEAKALEASGSLLKAGEAYQALVRDYPQGKLTQDSQKAAWDLNIKLLFSSIQTPDSKVYEVQPQDTLGKIARKFGTTVELIMRSNNLKSDLIRPRMKLKIYTAKFSILVDKSQNILTLKSGDEIFRVYPVATGLDNCTPVGAFKVTDRIVDPTWYKAGAIVPSGSPKNILGTRWIGLSAQGYGIHGTTEPESIGKQATAGCVRMVNRDVEELYTIIPSGTDVTIVD